MMVEVDCRGLSLFVSIVVVERRGNFGTDCSKCGADGTVFRASQYDALLPKTDFYVHVIHFNNGRDLEILLSYQACDKPLFLHSDRDLEQPTFSCKKLTRGFV